jgi:hypothetical protein
MKVAMRVLAGVLTGALAATALAQEIPIEVDVAERDEERTTDEAPIPRLRTSEGQARRQGQPVTVRTAPEQASATLDNVTWELLSRMAAAFLSGNRAELLSGNKPEVLARNETKLVSENELQVLSGNKISLFSNIKIEIHVSGVPNPAEMMGGRREIRIESRIREPEVLRPDTAPAVDVIDPETDLPVEEVEREPEEIVDPVEPLDDPDDE